MYHVLGQDGPAEFCLSYEGEAGSVAIRRCERPDHGLDLNPSPLLAQLYRRLDRAWAETQTGRKNYEPLLTAKARLKSFHIDRYHQQPCTPATVLRRVAALQRLGLNADKRVLVLGDDDLVSFALAAEGVRATVVEAAGNVLAVLRTLDGNVEPCHVTRTTMPSGEVDFVVTDPPYVGSGLVHFLRYALLALRPSGVLALSFLDYGGRGVLERLVQTCGLEVLRVQRNANLYLNPVTANREKNASDFLLLRRDGARSRSRHGMN